MTREEAILYVSFQIDHTPGRTAKPADVNRDDRLVGFHESPGIVMVVAVSSQAPGATLTDEVAKELARDYSDGDWFVGN